MACSAAMAVACGRGVADGLGDRAYEAVPHLVAIRFMLRESYAQACEGNVMRPACFAI